MDVLTGKFCGFYSRQSNEFRHSQDMNLENRGSELLNYTSEYITQTYTALVPWSVLSGIAYSGWQLCIKVKKLFVHSNLLAENARDRTGTYRRIPQPDLLYATILFGNIERRLLLTK